MKQLTPRGEDMKQYHVMWEIDVWANSPKEAAQSVLEIQRRHDSSAVVFDVTTFEQDGRPGEMVRIDLLDQE
jgi:hypothetical protein